jgi:hypothetical protein
MKQLVLLVTALIVSACQQSPVAIQQANTFTASKSYQTAPDAAYFTKFIQDVKLNAQANGTIFALSGIVRNYYYRTIPGLALPGTPGFAKGTVEVGFDLNGDSAQNLSLRHMPLNFPGVKAKFDKLQSFIGKNATVMVQIQKDANSFNRLRFISIQSTDGQIAKF